RTRAASTALRLYQKSGVRKLVRQSGVLERLQLDEREALLPEMSDDFFRPGREFYAAEGQRRGIVALLAGCIMSTAFAEVHRATARVLARNGFDVVVPPEQRCCGALSIHGGDLQAGRQLARSNIDAFETRDFDAVLSNSAGCGAAMREYDFLLRNDPQYAERARLFVNQVKDVSEFLAEWGLSRSPGPLNETVTYQEPCHLVHAQRVSSQPRDLLRQIPGLKLVEMKESSLCCGSAGIYNVLQPEMSRELRERKVDNASATGADVIVSANPGCILQLRAGLDARGDETPVEHIMSLLDRAYQAEEASVESGNRTTARVPTS
ncbi:MAG: (Fe-S)-binding protein, partial [Chloroflexota bacterium]